MKENLKNIQPFFITFAIFAVIYIICSCVCSDYFYFDLPTSRHGSHEIQEIKKANIEASKIYFQRLPIFASIPTLLYLLVYKLTRKYKNNILEQDTVTVLVYFGRTIDNDNWIEFARVVRAVPGRLPQSKMIEIANSLYDKRTLHEVRFYEGSIKEEPYAVYKDGKIQMK